jgi:hypothetical protein
MSKRNHQPMKAPEEYRVVADGINWPDPSAPVPEDPTHAPRDLRAERGDMVRLPPELAKAFLEAGHIETLAAQDVADVAPPAPEEVKE